MNFNLIPWDTEAYLIAADYAEENGCLLSNAIRDKNLPFDIEKGNGHGCRLNSSTNSYRFGDDVILGDGEGWGHGFGEDNFLQFNPL